jgi:septum formation protein
MFIATCPLILASASPRRKEYFNRLGLEYRVLPASLDETPELGESPCDFAQRMARGKAEQIANSNPKSCVIGADTVVALDQRIFGKPQDAEDALAMLSTLQGRRHEVTTAFALIALDRKIKETEACTTQVTFGNFTESILAAYVATGEPADKAGAYGIQGKGGFLVQTLSGSYSNVVGLPVYELVQALLRHGLVRVDNSTAMPLASVR